MKNKKIYIRLDANYERGMGHLFRMLALEGLFVKKNYKVRFIIRDNEISTKILKEKKQFFMSFPEDYSELQIIKNAIKDKSNNPDIWIFDILSTKADWIKYIQSKGIKVVCFDDTGGGLEFADLLINAIVSCWGEYNIKKSNKNIVFDIRYTIVHPDVFKYRNIRTISSKKILKIAISMGGSDTNASTILIASSLSELSPESYKFHFFTGPHFLHTKELKNIIQDIHCECSVKLFAKNLYKELNDADIVICNGGVTLFEVCTMGLPAIAFANENHEKKTISYLQKNNLCCYLGSYQDTAPDEIFLKLNNILTQRENLNKVSKKSYNFFSEQGIKLCLNKIIDL